MLAARLISVALTPGGKLLLGVAALLVWTSYQRQMAGAEVRAEFEHRIAQARLDAAETERALTREARQQADRAVARVAEMERERDGILAELRDRADSPAGCTIPDDVLRRLQRLQ